MKMYVHLLLAILFSTQQISKAEIPVAYSPFNNGTNENIGSSNVGLKSSALTSDFFYYANKVHGFEELDNADPSVVISGALTGDFSTLKEAFDALNAGGGSGNVTVTIKDNTTETVTAVLNQTNYVVTVVPQGNRVVQGNLSIALIVLDGANNVTFNGQTLTGAQTLTFRNTSTCANASVVRMQGSNSNNIIRKCIIEGGATSNNNFAAGIVMADGISGVSSSVDNIIDSNLIRPSTSGGLSYGISVGSTNGNFNNTFTNTQITNNLIENIFCNTSLQSTSISILNNAKNTLIRGNSIYNSITFNNIKTDMLYYGIRVASLSNTVGAGSIIDSNYVGGSAPLTAGSKMTINSPANRMQVITIFLQENISAAPSSVTRNVVNNLSLTTINNAGNDILTFSGIYVASANLQAFNNNKLGSAVNNSVNLATNPGSSARILIYGMATQVACATPIADNFLGGISLTATAPAGISGRPQFYGLFTRDAAATILKNNIIGASVPNSISVISTAPSDYWFYGIDNYAAVGSSTFSISNNIVRNIFGTKSQIICIFQENFLAGTTAVSGTITDNVVSDINVTGSPNSVMGIGYNTFSGITSLVHNLIFTNNQVKDISASSGSNNILRAINIVNDATSVNRIKGRIEGNSVSNVINNTGGTSGISRGINFANDIIIGDSMVIAANSVSGLTDASERVYISSVSTANSHGIGVAMNNSSDNGTAIVRDNSIHDIRSTSIIGNALRTQGLSVFGNSAIIERNKIYDLQNNAKSATARIEAILLRSRSDDGNVSLVRNNMIAVNTNTGAQIAGIRIQDANTKSNVYHNNILLEGKSINTSYALLKDADGIADVKNNILYNAISGVGTAFAIGLQTNANGYTGNNNYVISPATATLLQIGASSNTLANWQTATSQDVNTQRGQSVVNTNATDLFLNKSTGNLLINISHPTEPAKASNKGMALAASVPNDFLNLPRSLTTPDIGAHEFLFTGTLPLRLISFIGTKQNNNAQLKWLTANEINVARFEVERSGDGQNFVTIATVLPGINLYSFSDVDIFNKTSIAFYRLKSVDADGRFSFSRIVRLSNQLLAELSAFPNPVKDLVTITGLKENGIISLMTTQGKLLKKEIVTTQNITLDMSLYTKGAYLLWYTHKNKVTSVKIIKD